MRRLVRELGRHFPAIRDWEGEARRAEEQGKAAEFYIGVADALMEMPKEDIRKLPSFEARNLVQGFQELAEIYGKQEVRTRIAGFLVIQGQAHEFVELPYGPPTLDTLRLDLIDTTDPQTLPGRIPNAPSPKSEERERTATRPKFFTSDRGLSIFFLTPIDETAGRVSRKKTPR